MANFDVLKTTKQPCQIWVGLAVPGAGDELTLSSGEPDATENPNALHLGLTNDGATLLGETTTTEEYFDEFEEPLEETIDQRTLKITANLAQVMDFDVLEQILNGMGTRSDVSGKEKIVFGDASLKTTGCAVIFPLKEDPTKYGVFHLYKASFKSKFETPISRQTRGVIPVEIVGLGIPGRADADRIGAFWKQIS